MPTHFLLKKVISTVAASCLAFCLAVFAYTHYLKNAQSIFINANFYFLVSEEVHVEAGAEFIKLEGGAGYLLQVSGKEYVVLSTYLTEEDGVSVKTALDKQGRTTMLLSASVDRIYLKTQKEKRNASMYEGAFAYLYQCFGVLEKCILRLEEGATQESCKRLLQPLAKQLCFVGSEYEKTYPTFSELCQQASEEITKMQINTLYAKDFRYLLTALAEKYVAMGKSLHL